MTLSRSYDKVRDDQYKIDSKERLSKILKKKIKTTMIGAISSIEENFGFLWAEDSDIEEDTKIKMAGLFAKARSDILDRGNTQSRNVDAELSNYDTVWLRHTISIPVIKKTK